MMGAADAQGEGEQASQNYLISDVETTEAFLESNEIKFNVSNFYHEILKYYIDCETLVGANQR